MTALDFDETRTQAAEQLVRVVDATRAARGAMRAPDIDLTSEAHQQLKDDPVAGTAGFPTPIAQTLGRVERLIFAGDDQALGVAGVADDRGQEV